MAWRPLSRYPRQYTAFSGDPTLRDAVLFALGLGGDTDTIASMSGAIVGAYLGVDGIPQQWIEGVEGVTRMTELANSMFQKFHSEGSPAQ